GRLARTLARLARVIGGDRLVPIARARAAAPRRRSRGRVGRWTPAAPGTGAAAARRRGRRARPGGGQRLVRRLPRRDRGGVAPLAPPRRLDRSGLPEGVRRRAGRLLPRLSRARERSHRRA